MDYLAAYGSEISIDGDKDVFQDSMFRLVRSGDSKGQGFLAYAYAIRKATRQYELTRALFNNWDYQDDGFSLRWDPLEDQRYALMWNDPSKNKDYNNPKTMLGANALALEALVLFPTVLKSNKLATTGFITYDKRTTFFIWPIWDKPLSVELLRSVLTLKELGMDPLPRDRLISRGITEVYKCERIAPNKYYKNFAPSIAGL